MSLQSIPRTVGAPIAAGLFAGALNIIVGTPGNTRVAGINVPTPLAYAIVVAAASGVTEMSKNYIVPMITDDPLSMTASHLIQPVVSGASTAILSAALTGFKGASVQGMMDAAIIGAGSQLVANYAGEAIDRFVMSLFPSSQQTMSTMVI